GRRGDDKRRRCVVNGRRATDRPSRRNKPKSGGTRVGAPPSGGGCEDDPGGSRDSHRHPAGVPSSGGSRLRRIGQNKPKSGGPPDDDLPGTGSRPAPRGSQRCGARGFEGRRTGAIGATGRPAGGGRVPSRSLPPIIIRALEELARRRAQAIGSPPL